MIPAQPCHYNGITYRSRLESQWAMGFDTLELKYFYEPARVELPSGSYVPDFYLPDLKAWVEIKSERPWNGHTCRNLCSELARHTGRRAFLILGTFLHQGREYEIEVFDPDGSQDYSYEMCMCPKRDCDCVGITWGGIANRLPCGCFGDDQNDVHAKADGFMWNEVDYLPKSSRRASRRQTEKLLSKEVLIFGSPEWVESPCYEHFL
jgi:hypothetical protein